MELRHFQHFVAVAEERNFTRAARRLHIVQSALSNSVRSLEDELGVQLLERSTRHVSLTAEGSIFLDKARAVVCAAQEASAAVCGSRAIKKGLLRIGTVGTLPAFLDLPALLVEYHAHHPQIEVRLLLGCAVDLLEKVRDGKLDLAFLPLSEPPIDIATRPVECVPMVGICTPDHPLAGRREVSLTELRSEPFVELEPGSGTRRIADQAFVAAGVRRRIAFEVNDVDTALNLVRRGLGIIMLPEAVALRHSTSVGMFHLAEPEICWELVVAYRIAESKPLLAEASQRFLDLLDRRK
jgi:DNA-binding transcriptional LysR family regulator